MYCQTCNCEYSGWTYRCPVCKTQLQESRPELPAAPDAGMPYDELLEQVRKRGGMLVFEMTTVQVRKKKKLGFPHRGFGFAWASRLHGELDGLTVELFTARVGEDQAWSFPYFGYGFAWEQEMEGQVQGCALALRARKVNRERRQAFPYLGYGYAWTEELEGQCGPQLEAVFKTTQVDRSRGYLFPFFGFGYAWIARAELSLRRVDG